ncbi:MAG: glycosyltransferase family 2 protein, partial [Victivallaceae bacterium]|nr:glycosyltransferase family 2 protein [Victivallaceae bacterium]
MKKNRISVIVPMYCVAKLLARGIASLKSQTGDFEVLLIDDGSPDETRTAAETLTAGDSRFRVIAETHHGTAAAMRNRGVELAGGDYVFFMDADDELEPTALSDIAAAWAR